MIRLLLSNVCDTKILFLGNLFPNFICYENKKNLYLQQHLRNDALISLHEDIEQGRKDSR